MIMTVTKQTRMGQCFSLHNMCMIIFTARTIVQRFYVLWLHAV